MPIVGIHHIAIICADYQRSKHFYTEILGLEVLQETYREERDSYKLDLSINGDYCIELFSFPSPPTRVSRPEASGLRHLAFKTLDLDAEINRLKDLGVVTEPVRTDALTQRRFTFFSDPDDLPLELYEIVDKG